MSTDYKKQANDFLTETSTTFTATFLKHGKHFDNDKDSRDIFKCTLKRGTRSYTFNFGQSINDSTGKGKNPPTAYDVLACINKYDPGTFENFCSEYDYDTDSRTAEKTYKGVIEEWQAVERLFTDNEIEKLQEIA